MKKRKKRDITDTLLDYGYHSHSYHKYFESYAETILLDGNGTKKIVRTYVGDYYHRELTKKQDICLKVGYGALFVAATVPYLMVGSAPIEGNLKWYVFLPEVLNMLLLLWLFKTIVYYLLTKRKLTMGEYKSSSKDLLHTSAAATASFILTIIGLLNSMRDAGGSSGTVLACAAGIAVCGCCTVAIFAIEKNVEYARCSNEAEPPEDASFM